MNALNTTKESDLIVMEIINDTENFLHLKGRY